MSKELEKYFELQKKKPDLFHQDSALEIILDEETIESYQQSHPGEKIGVLYESAYHLLVKDLVKEDGAYHPMERLLQVHPGGVVMIPRQGNHFILLNQFRHGIRQESIGFPRGFGEEGLSSLENAKKELQEELGVSPQEVTYLGNVILDTSISDKDVDIYLCDLEETDIISLEKKEGMLGYLQKEKEEIDQMIRDGEITDSYTLCAWQLWNQK